jgi:hypothetical protein
LLSGINYNDGMLIARALAVVALAASVAVAAGPSIPPAEWLLDQVKVLSAPDMAGRASGTPGAERAARHIAAVFQQAGLAPGGDAGTYLQAFQVPTGIRLGAANSLTLLAPARRPLALGRDFAPLTVSEDGAATAPAVFAGYGITAPDLQYDDYAGLDVRGKIVLVLTGEPRGTDPASPFRRPDAYHYSERSHKIINAREHGARGILLVRHPGAGAEALPELRGISQPWSILAAAVTRAHRRRAPGLRRQAARRGRGRHRPRPRPSVLCHCRCDGDARGLPRPRSRDDGQRGGGSPGH